MVKRLLALLFILSFTSQLNAQWFGPSGSGPWILETDRVDDEEEGEEGEGESEGGDEDDDDWEWFDDIVDPWEDDPPAKPTNPGGDTGSGGGGSLGGDGELVDPWGEDNKATNNAFSNPMLGGKKLDKIGALYLKMDGDRIRRKYDRVKVGSSWKGEMGGKRGFTFELMAKGDRTPRTNGSYELSFRVSWIGERSGKKIERPLYIVVHKNKAYYLTRKK